MPRNRAAQDATLINLRAAKKQIANLETRVRRLERAFWHSGVIQRRHTAKLARLLR